MLKLIDRITALNQILKDQHKEQNMQVESFVEQAVKVKLNPLTRN